MCCTQLGRLNPEEGAPTAGSGWPQGLSQQLFIPPNRVQTLVWLEGSHGPFILLDSPSNPPHLPTTPHSHTHTQTPVSVLIPTSLSSFMVVCTSSPFHLKCLPLPHPLKLSSRVTSSWKPSMTTTPPTPSWASHFRESPQVLLPSLSRLWLPCNYDSRSNCLSLSQTLKLLQGPAQRPVHSGYSENVCGWMNEWVLLGWGANWMPFSVKVLLLFSH